MNKVKRSGKSNIATREGRKETMQKTKNLETNKWKTFHVHGLEDLMLKCPYFPKQSTDSM